jgi:hypothetical protein
MPPPDREHLPNPGVKASERNQRGSKGLILTAGLKVEVEVTLRPGSFGECSFQFEYLAEELEQIIEISSYDEGY